MVKTFEETIDQKSSEKTETFLKKIDSIVSFKSNLSSNSMSFEWLDEIELACPYIDTIVRNPKLTLTTEENVIKIEKSKQITVASIKDLSRHSHYIGKVDKKTQDLEPSKILDIRKEETFDIYENRFLFTLLTSLTKFVMTQEEILDDFEVANDKILRYSGTSFINDEKVNIDLKVTSNIVSDGEDSNDFSNEIKVVRERLDRVKDYMSSWRRSELIKSLNKAHIGLVSSPIKKTNLILKNPSFQICTRLWYFLQKFNAKANDSVEVDANVVEPLQKVLDHSFLLDYYVLDSVCKSKKEQKQNLKKYAYLIVEQEIDRMVSLLLASGAKITDEEILKMVSNTIKNHREINSINDNDVKNKFKNAMEEYLEKTQEYL